MTKFKDISGLKFNRLLVLNFVEKRSGDFYFLCRCDCGQEKEVPKGALTRGVTKSCGCYRRSIVGAHGVKHNGTHTKLYRIWYVIIYKCRHDNIAICNEWKDFSNFREWALCNGYRSDLFLYRKNIKWAFEPSNCEWVTRKIKYTNTNNSIIITYKNKSMPFLFWIDHLGLDYHRIYDKMRRGASFDQAVEMDLNYAKVCNE
jgi:hypothetical protein